MIERWEGDDPGDARLAVGADGLLGAFNAAGVLVAADVRVAQRAAALVGADDAAALALALTVRAARQGSVCLDLAELVAVDDTLPWPSGRAADWVDAVAAGPLAARGVLRVEAGSLYLDRYWREEGQVRDDLLAREGTPVPPHDPPALQACADRVFPGEAYAEQRAAALVASQQTTTVLTGGPGTGKTTTVAGLLAMLSEQAALAGRPLRVALCAPTGKAAARLSEAVRTEQQADRFTADDRARLAGLTSATLHRLLGWRPGSRTRFRHHRDNRLPHDVVVVDETSMVSLTLMARLLEAVRPEARLVLVGDPDQLASVEAGAVLADLAQGLEARAPHTVARLVTPRRFGARIDELAAAIRAGDGDGVVALLRDGGRTDEQGRPELALLDPADDRDVDELRTALVDHGLRLRDLAAAGDGTAAVAALDEHRLLCAHREGPYGVHRWNAQVERWLAEASGEPIGAAWGPPYYVGRPLLVTANDYGLGLFNGDTGVVVRADAAPGGVHVLVSGAGRPYATTRLSEVETMHATTVHKSQGSQAREVSVLLPPDDSPLLTRELLYTAVTRAQQRVRVVATEAALRAAVDRRAQRASGLRRRLVEGGDGVASGAG